MCDLHTWPRGGLQKIQKNNNNRKRRKGPSLECLFLLRWGKVGNLGLGGWTTVKLYFVTKKGAFTGTAGSTEFWFHI
jgi:hypothetical protein